MAGPKRHVHIWGDTVVEGTDPLRPRERQVLSALAFAAPDGVSIDRIISLVWGPIPPATAHQSVHNHIRRLRVAVPGLVTTTETGYRLASDAVVDAEEMARWAATEPGAIDPDRDLGPLSELLAATQSHPFQDLQSDAAVDARRSELLRLRPRVEDLHLYALLRAGKDAAAVASAEHLVEADPDRERRWWLLAVALARTGQRRDALAVIARARSHLADRGLDLGWDLQTFERLIITADPIISTGAVLEASAPAGMSRHATSELVGAEFVVEAIESRIAAEMPTTLLLVGRAGAGKTTITEFAARHAGSLGWATYVVGCDPEPARPLQPVAELLTLIAHQDDRALTSEGLAPLGVLDPVLSSMVGVPERNVEQHDLLAAIARVIGSLTRPTLVVIEDVHWAPPLTMAAIEAMLRALSTPVVLVLTSRPDDRDLGAEFGIDQVQIPLWSVAHVEDWLIRHEPDPVRRRAAAGWLHEQSGGVPIFVRELTLGLLVEGRIGSTARGEFAPPTAVPPAVLVALAARVDRLPPPTARTLEIAAVLGSRVPVAVLDSLVPQGGAHQVELLRIGMLRPVGNDALELQFEHELLRRAVLDRLSEAAVAEIHHLALQAHHGVDGMSAAVAARHAVGAAPLDPRRAVDASIAAAQAATESAAHAEAGTWWLTAAGLHLEHGLSDEAAHCELRIQAGHALLLAGDSSAADVLFDAAEDARRRRDWDSVARAAIALCRLGPTSLAGQPHEGATVLAEQVLPHVSSPGLRAQLAAVISMLYSMAGEPQRCRALYLAAEADATVDGTDEVLVDVLRYCYMSVSAPEDLDRREAVTDRLDAAAHRLGRLDALWSSLHLRFSNELQRGDPHLRVTAQGIVALTPRVGERQRDWEERYVLATVAHLDGDLARSEALIEDTLSYTDAVAPSRITAVYGVQLLALRHSQGRLHELVEVIAGLVDDQPQVGAWRAALALAGSHGGQHRLGTEAFDSIIDGSVELSQDYTQTGALVALGEAAIELGDRSRGAKVAALLEPWAGRWSWVGTCTLGPIDTTRAGLALLQGDRGAAEQAATAAVMSCEALDAPGFGAVAAARRGGARSESL